LVLVLSVESLLKMHVDVEKCSIEVKSIKTKTGLDIN